MEISESSCQTLCLLSTVLFCDLWGLVYREQVWGIAHRFGDQHTQDLELTKCNRVSLSG